MNIKLELDGVNKAPSIKINDLDIEGLIKLEIEWNTNELFEHKAKRILIKTLQKEGELPVIKTEVIESII